MCILCEDAGRKMARVAALRVDAAGRVELAVEVGPRGGDALLQNLIAQAAAAEAARGVWPRDEGRRVWHARQHTRRLSRRPEDEVEAFEAL